MRRLRVRLGLLVLAAALALATARASGAEEYGPDLDTYRVLVERYRSGDIEIPVRVAGSWGPIWIRSTADRVLKALDQGLEPESGGRRSGGDSAERTRRTRDTLRLAQGAFLLHTHAALAGHEMDLRPLDHDAHVAAARRILRWIRKQYERAPAAWPEEARGLRPRHFYLALAAGELVAARQEMALDLARESLSREKNDAAMRLLAGCAMETLAQLERQPSRRVSERRASELLSGAERWFRQALDDEPALLEARLRLGWVLVRRGRAREARPHLEAVAESPGDPGRRALAWLFLGKLYQQLGEGEARVAAYGRAVEAAPRLEVAQIALAHALEELEGDEAARRILVPFFQERSRSWTRDDPWVDYPFGPPGLRLVPFAVLVERICQR